MKKQIEALSAAAEVAQSRSKEYGEENSFSRIAQLWTAYLNATGNSAALMPSDVARMLELFKMARALTRQASNAPVKEDDAIDAVSYAAWAYALECAERMPVPDKRPEICRVCKKEAPILDCSGACSGCSPFPPNAVEWR